jgi:hypothetical protein
VIQHISPLPPPLQARVLLGTVQSGGSWEADPSVVPTGMVDSIKELL